MVGVVLGDGSSLLYLASVLRRWRSDPILPPEEEARRRSCTRVSDSICATTASAPGNGGRSDGDCDQAHDDDANDDWRARGDHEPDACDDVHGSVRGACCASRVLRWGATTWCQTAKGALDVPLKSALFIEEIRSNQKRRDPHPPTFYIMTNLNPKEVTEVKPGRDIDWERKRKWESRLEYVYKVKKCEATKKANAGQIVLKIGRWRISECGSGICVERQKK